MDAQAALQQYFGHSAFRPGQQELVDALLNGQDVLGVMPTGAGKSVCYQVPALLLPGVTLVISPLISLMKDQVAALREAGIPAAFINSSRTAAQNQEVLTGAAQGKYRLLYVAPERLLTVSFLQFARSGQVSLVAVDEAHCVSQWGQDFRPGYLDIADFLHALPQRPAVGAFTATATDKVKTDIAQLLELNDPLTLTTGFDRPNLYFEVAEPRDKTEWLLEYLQQHRDSSGIVYCSTRKAVESVGAALRLHGVTALCYHAGLRDVERKQNQENFIYDRAQVMVATNAFGMGIDKSNVSFVVHYNMPKDLESYYQEAGRAGRDGEAAECILLYSARDVQTARFLISHSEKNDALSDAEQQELLRRDLRRLDKMTDYCKTSHCLRAYILAYFGETAPGSCGNCGNCRHEFAQKDITVATQKILSGVVRAEHCCGCPVGETLIVRMLHGSHDQRVLEMRLNELSTYGILRDCTQSQIRDMVDYLTAEGYLHLAEGQFPVLRCTEKAAGVLRGKARVTMPVRAETLRPARVKPAALALTPADEPLFAALKVLRTKLAQREGVPAYIIFSNATLADMAHKKPRSLTQLREVSGVGGVKAERYGQSFLQVVKNHLDASAD